MWIQSEDWAGCTCQLMCETTGLPIYKGDVRNGHTVISGTAPHKPSSTGRVYVEAGMGYYPSVVGAEWVRVKA